jgi:hypothetical protein
MQRSNISYLGSPLSSSTDSIITECERFNDFHLASISISPDNEQILSQFSSFVLSLDPDKAFSQDTGIMPPGVLHIDSNLIIFERPPQYQNVQLIPQVVESIDYDRHDSNLYRLPIPWQVYICTYNIYGGRYYPNSVRMYFMDSSLTGSDILSQRIYLPPLPNFYTSGLLCNPMYASMDDIERYPNDISGVIQASYDWIWNSGTNLDLTMNIVEAHFQLLPLKSKNVPTVFDKDSLNSASLVSSSSFYLDFSSIDFFFKLWEQFQLHEVSSLVWPNASFSDRVVGQMREVQESFLQDFFAENNITDPPSRIVTIESDCEDEDCDCDQEETSRRVYSYSAMDYARYVRSRLSSMLTCGQALNLIRNSNLSSNLHNEHTIENFSRALLANSQLLS